MAEYTKIETARTIICDFCNQLYSDEPCEPADCDWLRMLEEDAADVAPVRHGRGIMVDDSCGKYACSACREIEQECTEWGAGHYNPVYKDYCPNCGAQMDEKEDKHEDYT